MNFVCNCVWLYTCVALYSEPSQQYEKLFINMTLIDEKILDAFPVVLHRSLEDQWGDVSYQCEAYWTNLASHTMKCSDTHVSMYIIISDKRLT